MAERWVVKRNTGVVAKKKHVRGSQEPDHNEFFKPRPTAIAMKNRNLKDPFNVVWKSGDDL
jgi:hypothetical protein